MKTEKSMKKSAIVFAVLATVIINSTFVTAEQINNSVKNESIENEFDGTVINLSLDEAIKAALGYNSLIKEAELRIEQANIDYEQAQSAMKKSRQRFGSMKKDSLLYLQNITLQELSGEFTKANAERNNEATINKLKEEVEQYYFGLVQAINAKRISDESIKLSREIYEITKKKYELGLISKQELLNGELTLLEARTRGYSAENNVLMARMGFNIKLGFDVMQNVMINEDIKYRELPVINISAEVKKAIESRAEIKALQFSLKIAETKFVIADKAYTPNTFVYRESDLAVKKALQSLEDIIKVIELQVRSNHLSMNQKYNEIKTLEKSVELAQTGLELSKVTYNAGLIKATDVQGAVLTLEAKKMELSRAILDYNISYLRFEHVTGVGNTVE